MIILVVCAIKSIYGIIQNVRHHEKSAHRKDGTSHIYSQPNEEKMKNHPNLKSS